MVDARVAIIGGGIMGVSLAYHLTRLGWSDVLLFEKNDLTHGSTWHAAGLCTHFAHNPTIQELRATSVRLYRDTLPEETGLDTGFHPSGAMRVTRSPDRMAEFSHVANLSRFTGYGLRLISPDEIAEFHPFARLDGLIGGIFEPDDGHVDPTSAVNALAFDARRRGAELRRFESVRTIHRDASWLIETDRGTYSAEHIVNAAGTWAREIGQMMGINVPSTPILHQYLVTDRIAAVAERDRELPIIRDPEESWYLRQERDGLIIGPYETEAEVWSPDQVPEEFGADLLPPDLDRVEHIVAAAMDRIPVLAEAGIKTVVNGPITFSPDANPLIGPVFGNDTAWLMTGSSMGVMEGGGAGWFLAHWIVNGAPPMDALSVDPRRFGQWAGRTYRIDKAKECFGLQFGVHYPFEERPAGRNLRQTPLYQAQAAAGAIFGAAYGWERPLYYGKQSELTFGRPGWFDHCATEVSAVTKGAGIADLSAYAKFELSGPDLDLFLNTLGTNTPPPPGKVALTYGLTEQGGVDSEFSILRVSADLAYLVSAAAAEERDHDRLRRHTQGYRVDLKNRTSTLGIIGLMGPNASSILEAISAEAFSQNDFPWLTTRTCDVAGQQVLASRLSYVGEAGWELMMQMSSLPTVWEELIESSARPFGAYAINSMRLEKGYRAWGLDLTTERTPSELGLSRFCKLDDRAFKGRTALQEQQDRERWRSVLLEIEPGGSDPFYAHTVLSGGQPAGVITSAGFGHRTGTLLGLALLQPGTSDEDLSTLVVEQERAVRVLTEPPFDPENMRLRA